MVVGGHSFPFYLFPIHSITQLLHRTYNLHSIHNVHFLLVFLEGESSKPASWDAEAEMFKLDAEVSCDSSSAGRLSALSISGSDGVAVAVAAGGASTC